MKQKDWTTRCTQNESERARETLIWLAGVTEKETGNAQPGACVDVLPRCWLSGFGALNSSPHSWIFTSVSVGSSPRSFVFTFATVRSVHTAPKHHYGTKPIRNVKLQFWGWRSLASLLHRSRAATTVLVCEQKPYLIWFSWHRISCPV